MLNDGEPIHCVWSGRRLRQDGLDIDHCLPFTARPSADLWNPMPSHPRVNRHEKADRLISASLLEAVGDRIATWWECAYLRLTEILASRFGREATASLPVETVTGQHVSIQEVLDTPQLNA